MIKNEEDICEVSIVEGRNRLKLRNLTDITEEEDDEDDDDDSLSDCKATGINISIEEWPGECQFKMDRKSLALPMEKEKASDATYSTLLDKLFCDINKCFSIRFYLGNPGGVYANDSLWIRAMVAYTSPGDSGNPVLRCPNHSNPSDPINRQITDPAQLEHVLWSADRGARYEKNEILSLIHI